MKITENNSVGPETERFEPDGLFLSPEALRAVAVRCPTPFFLFDEKGLRERAKSLRSLFSFSPKTVHSFPVRRCPNAEILRILRE